MITAVSEYFKPICAECGSWCFPQKSREGFKDWERGFALVSDCCLADVIYHGEVMEEKSYSEYLEDEHGDYS